jgi:hypothetical protein
LNRTVAAVLRVKLTTVPSLLRGLSGRVLGPRTAALNVRGETDSLLIAGTATNVAVTLVSALSVTVQVVEAVAQAPLQPSNRD